MENTLYKFTSSDQMKVHDNTINDPMIMTEEEFLADESKRVELQDRRLHPERYRPAPETKSSNQLDRLTTGEIMSLRDYMYDHDGPPPWL